MGNYETSFHFVQEIPMFDSAYEKKIYFLISRLASVFPFTVFFKRLLRI